MRVGIISFARSPCDTEATSAVLRFGHRPVLLEPGEHHLRGSEVLLLGGAGAGITERCGTLARLSPLMEEVVAFARDGGRVLGFCGGFQVLIELGLLPGLLLPGASRRFVSGRAQVEVANTDSVFTRSYTRGQRLQVHVSHMDAHYFIDAQAMRRLEEDGRVAFRFVEGPEGGLHGVAGLLNEWGNVLGMMPHPEQASLELKADVTDGQRLPESFLS
jgi:phosphoribosylformylglycinamidine synthase